MKIRGIVEEVVEGLIQSPLFCTLHLTPDHLAAGESTNLRADLSYCLF